MSMHNIILVDLDDQIQGVIESCLREQQFKITRVDSDSWSGTCEQVALVIFKATDDVQHVQRLCASIRGQFGQSVPLLACVGRYTFAAIRPLLETDLQEIIITPFDADEFRTKLAQMELKY